MRWVEITIEARDTSADAASNILLEEGCQGAATTQIADEPSGGGPDIVGYLPVDDRLEARLENIRDRVRQLPELGLKLRSKQITIRWVHEEDWADAWKKFFKPIKIGRIVIKPSWEDYAAQADDIIIDIDPGMAFGTGYHDTTQLCLMALQEHLNEGDTVLDVGTGSGILAMAAARLGASRVVGLENDPVAVDAAQANVNRMGLDDIIKIELAESPLTFKGEADLVLVNIIPKVIIGMAEDLAVKVRPGGKLIASGIVPDRAKDVIGKLESVGLELLEDKRSNEWVALVTEKQA
ncbi:MAG: 50S ribosomal protein L11 methyltransferase [Armatimonadota bacterium]|nr:50S ribosomal protein L11 methyltransferase [bacterium]